MNLCWVRDYEIVKYEDTQKCRHGQDSYYTADQRQLRLYCRQLSLHNQARRQLHLHHQRPPARPMMALLWPILPPAPLAAQAR